MSYDTSIVIDTSDPDGLTEVCEVGNMTSNVGGMYYRAMPGPYAGGGRYAASGEPNACGGLPGLSGLSCSEAAPILRAGIEYMEQNPEEMRALEPPNGWGSYSAALNYLWMLQAACVRHSKGVVSVSW